MRQITIPEFFQELVQNKEKPGKTTEQIAETLKIEKRQIKSMTSSSKISNDLISKIRKEVGKKKTKIQVAKELGVSYYMVKKVTEDIPTIYRIPVELEQRIREEVNKGKTKIQVAEELNVSCWTVWKYTRDIIRCRKTPPEVIEQIRRNAQKYKSKLEMARKLGIPYSTVRCFTEDIQLRTRLSTEKIEKIRNKVKNGKTKTQVAKEMNIHVGTVSAYTKDIYQVRKKADMSIRGFLMLRELMDKGYAFSCSQYGLKEYQVLKLDFPKICRVKMYGRTIFYLEDRADIAMRTFLENIDRKIISYQELQQIIDIFKGDISKKDKEKYIQKRRK